MAISGVVKYREDFPQEAYEMALLGLSDTEMARIWGVTEATIAMWKRTKPDFAERIKEGRSKPDREVAKAFYKMCIGYDYYEEEVVSYKGVVQVITVKKHMPPDKWAAFKWLSVHQRAIWSETQRIEINRTNTNINIDLSALDTKELLIAKKLGIQNLFPAEDATIVKQIELPAADGIDEDQEVA
jgi:hypothetical protein